MVAEKEEPLLHREVLYIGSSVPMETADGLDAIQQPLKERYPVNEGRHLEGIMSHMTILPSGLQLQYVNEPSTIIWFPITSLTLCAAVRCIHTINTATGEKVPKFVSLSSPAAGGANCDRPAIFTAITRRTKGLKVLECHGFVCKNDKDAMDLVKLTSFSDRMSKKKLNGKIHTHPLPSETNTMKTPSIADGAANTEFPVRLAPGEQKNVAPEFFDTPPQNGYFYNTKNSKVKKYAIEKFSDGDPERPRITSHPPQFSARPLSERRPMFVRPPHPPGMTLQRPAPMLPIRPIPPPARPRFFSPPPTLLRPRVVARVRDPHVFVPPPPVFIDAPYVIKRRPQRRGSAGSSASHSHEHASSRSSSPKNDQGDFTFPKRAVNGDADASSEVSSRPQTPPTDYDGRRPTRGERMSRRDEYEFRSRTTPRDRPDDRFSPPPHLMGGPYLQDFYVYPQPINYPFPYYSMNRARSVPPPAERSTNKKKGRKNKKDKKQKNRRHHHHGAPSDVSTDSIGYQSEIPPNMLDRSYQRMPRNFMRFENQYKHERAFSRSLAEQNKQGSHLESPSAYALNEHMSERARNGLEDEFAMY